MERLLNKKWWQKLIIALFIVIMFTSIVAKPVQAMDADILLKPITGLFVGLADALEGVMQKIVLGVDESLIKVVYDEPEWWETALIIGALVIGAVAAIALSYFTGGASAAIYFGFLVAVGVFAVSLGVGALTGKNLVEFVNDMLSDKVYFPQFALSPYEIFDDKITVLDVNFFNPKETEIKVATEKKWLRIEIPREMVVDYDPDDEIIYVKQEMFDNYFGFNSDPDQDENLASGDKFETAVTATMLRMFGGMSNYSFYNWHKDDRWFEAAIWDKVNYNGTYIRGVKCLREHLDAPKNSTIKWAQVLIPEEIIDSQASVGDVIKNGKPVDDEYAGLYLVDKTKFQEKYGFGYNLNQMEKEDNKFGSLLKLQGKNIGLVALIDSMEVYTWEYNGKTYGVAIGEHPDYGDDFYIYNLQER